MSLEDVKAIAAQQRGTVAAALRWAISQIELLQSEQKEREESTPCYAHAAKHKSSG